MFYYVLYMLSVWATFPVACVWLGDNVLESVLLFPLYRVTKARLISFWQQLFAELSQQTLAALVYVIL